MGDLYVVLGPLQSLSDLFLSRFHFNHISLPLSACLAVSLVNGETEIES